MNKKKEVTQHSTAKDTSQIVPTGANLPRLTLVKRGDQEILSADTTDLTEWYDELAAAFASKNKDRDIVNAPTLSIRDQIAAASGLAKMGAH